MNKFVAKNFSPKKFSIGLMVNLHILSIVKFIAGKLPDFDGKIISIYYDDLKI